MLNVMKYSQTLIDKSGNIASQKELGKHFCYYTHLSATKQNVDLIVTNTIKEYNRNNR